MSVQAIAWVLDHSQATLGTRLVAIAVANHADKNGRDAWASVSLYAEEARLSERQVQYALRELERSGEIRKAGRRGARADRQTTVYEFPAMCDGVQILHLADSPRGAESGSHGVQPIAPEPTANRPKTRAPRKRDAVFDALVAIEHADGELTRRHARSIGVALAEIREVAPDVTPAEVRRRATIYAQLMPGAALTANALAKHWARCGGSVAAVRSVAEVDAEWARRRAEDDAAVAALLAEDAAAYDRRAD